MDHDELAGWLRLLLTPRLGPAACRALLATFGSPQAIFHATPSALSACLKPADVARVRLEPPALSDAVLRTQTWLAAADEVAPRAVLTLGDAAYPADLLALADPPLLLFAQGDVALLRGRAVAMVGSRSPTAQGRDNAHAFARALSEAGVTVVSGLAQGVDGAAHEGALEGGTGRTIAVVGTGLDRVYPKEHLELAHRIAQSGLLLSEFPLGTPPRPGHFPKRNRLVAALSRATLVVEAALQSGSLITARLAGELGREVLAIPGSIHSPQSRGCHALIKQGAKLVETAQDVLEELNWGLSTAARKDMPDEAESPLWSDEADCSSDPVLRAMGYDPVSQEALSARTGMGPADLGARLLELELLGQVARLPGALYQRIGLT